MQLLGVNQFICSGWNSNRFYRNAVEIGGACTIPEENQGFEDERLELIEEPNKPTCESPTENQQMLVLDEAWSKKWAVHSISRTN